MTFPALKGGPDAARYIALAQGHSVSRPFHLRRLLPALCGVSPARWWLVWGASWPLSAVLFIAWRTGSGDSAPVAVAGAVLLLALPGILGPTAVIPVGVDLPTLATLLGACALWSHDLPLPAVAVVMVAAGMKETAPVFAALWLWSPWPLLALVVPAAVHLLNKPGPDPLGARFDHIAAHPIRSAMAAHSGRWRDGWLMVAPWGVCLAALDRPSWPLAAVLTVAYLQLMVATDTVRLVHHAAGPVLAFTAAQVIPPHLLVAACVAHVVWWRTPERI